MMKFYQENKINPFGSCLPLAAQLPVFISLYYMLRTSLRHDICPQLQPAHGTVPCGPHGGAGFLFIPDLTNHATGAVLVVLLVLYVGTQLASSLLMTNSATMDKNQRYLMLAMPVFFVIFVIRFPAGVLVYWITTNAWTMAQQYVIKRRLGPVPTAAGAVVDAAGGPSGGGSANGRGGSGTSDAPAPSGGLADRLRGRAGRGEATGGSTTATAERPAETRSAPPPPPRKKKKQRSGRRR
jgi:YidC/Oxa1 family membrane protein insertase